MKRQLQSGFTLIELLAVIAIMGIILTAGVLSLHGLMKSAALSTGTRQVANTLNLARQYAITHRTYTRVVFPCARSWNSMNPASAATNNLAPWYLSYSVMARTNANLDPVFATEQYIYISKWEQLPVGTVFSTGLDTLPWATTPPNYLLPFPTNVISRNFLNTATLSYVQFDPTGAASGGDRSFTIWEGYITNGIPAFTTAANVGTISVDGIIGRVRLARK